MPQAVSHLITAQDCVPSTISALGDGATSTPHRRGRKDMLPAAPKIHLANGARPDSMPSLVIYPETSVAGALVNAWSNPAGMNDNENECPTARNTRTQTIGTGRGLGIVVGVSSTKGKMSVVLAARRLITSITPSPGRSAHNSGRICETDSRFALPVMPGGTQDESFVVRSSHKKSGHV